MMMLMASLLLTRRTMPAIRLAGPTTSSVKRAAVMTCFLTSFNCSPFHFILCGAPRLTMRVLAWTWRSSAWWSGLYLGLGTCDRGQALGLFHERATGTTIREPGREWRYGTAL